MRYDYSSTFGYAMNLPSHPSVPKKPIHGGEEWELVTAVVIHDHPDREPLVIWYWKRQLT